MSSASLALLILLKRQLHQKGFQVSIQGLHGQPKSLCEVLRLNNLLLGEMQSWHTKEIRKNKL